MGAWAERQMMRIRERAMMEFDTIGVEITADVREKISKPVEGSGYNATRSLPGEPPRKETGHLWASQSHNPVETPRGVALDIINTADYAYTLDILGVYSMKYGGTFTRPFFSPTIDRWFPSIGSRVVNAIVG